MFSKLSGKKSYIVACLIALYGIGGYLLGKESVDGAIKLVLEAAALAGLRNAIK